MRILAAICAALLVAACGGSGGSRNAGQSVPMSTATTPAAPVTTTVASAATTTTAPSGPRRCRAADLALAYLGGQAATGHGLLGFALRNTGSAACHTYGYPGVLFLDQAGAPLPTVPFHTRQDFFGSLPESPLTLAPGQSASFRLGVTHGAASTAPCSTAEGLQVIPPDDTATLRVRIPHGAYECRDVTVSPLQPGTSAYP